jgi:CRISPR-associated endoribonuclease Cas6/Csy4 subtype I-F
MMQPRYYFTLAIHSVRDVDIPKLSSVVFQQLHGFFAAEPHTYALAFPCYGDEIPSRQLQQIRVFAETSVQLETVQRYLQAQEMLPLTTEVTNYPICSVPDPYTGAWCCYARYRIPTRRAERHPNGDLRQRRIREADARQLPYFIVNSSSTKQLFSLYIERLPEQVMTGLCQPDCYGLSVTSRRFAVPEI